VSNWRVSVATGTSYRAGCPRKAGVELRQANLTSYRLHTWYFVRFSCNKLRADNNWAIYIHGIRSNIQHKLLLDTVLVYQPLAWPVQLETKRKSSDKQPQRSKTNRTCSISKSLAYIKVHIYHCLCSRIIFWSWWLVNFSIKWWLVLKERVTPNYDPTWHREITIWPECMCATELQCNHGWDGLLCRWRRRPGRWATAALLSLVI
jgi:hypothetical protein